MRLLIGAMLALTATLAPIQMASAATAAPSGHGVGVGTVSKTGCELYAGSRTGVGEATAFGNKYLPNASFAFGLFGAACGQNHGAGFINEFYYDQPPLPGSVVCRTSTDGTWSRASDGVITLHAPGNCYKDQRTEHVVGAALAETIVIVGKVAFISGTLA